jgi:coproporphyrinogen III oxidase-like Fe-S oxidoreductase
MNLDADPADAVECAAMSWLVEHGKEPQELEWEKGSVYAWAWWRQGRAGTCHTLPESLYRHLPGCNPLCSWCRYESYQEAVAAFLAAYASWQSSGASESGKGV